MRPPRPEQVNKAVADLRGVLGGFNTPGGGGRVQKALTDPALYNNLNDTVINVARLTVRLDKVARDLEVFSDKIARRPETLGVSGVVKPNTGLKDPPTTALPPSPPLPLAPTQTGVPAAYQQPAAGQVQADPRRSRSARWSPAGRRSTGCRRGSTGRRFDCGEPCPPGHGHPPDDRPARPGRDGGGRGVPVP